MLKWTGVLIRSASDHRINKTEKFYDLVVDDYKPAPVTLRTLEEVKKYLMRGDRVLDFGCADGTISLEIAGNVKEVCGIDISPGMIGAAKRKAAERKTGNACFLPVTIFDDRLKMESFDVILAFNILHAFRDCREEIQRINELLKPGGLFITFTPCMGEKKTLLGTLISLLVKTGVFPCIRFFKISELEDLIAGESFQTVETENFSADNQPLLFIVARKLTGTGRLSPTNQVV
jgi:2-polyprenyl-3-methyl-5-hydroxy-6-metoxy-1,4-benzoquinol methylase